MAGSPDDNKKTGVTHFAPEEEKKNQERVPPRGVSKEEMKTISQSGPEQNPARVADDADEQTISRRSAKGGKTGGGAD
jgi:hypothetical protein